MKMRNFSATLLLPTLALAACATTDQLAQAPESSRQMNAEEISALLSRSSTFDNAIRGGMRYEFKPSGDVAYSMRMMKARKTGKWKLEGDRLCINVDGDAWDCGEFYRISETRFYFGLRGYDRDYNTLDLK
jgi:hypothetical protein